MKKLIKYIKTHKVILVTHIKLKYLTKEVKDVLSRYNLTLYELCYRLKRDISLDKVFRCNYCSTKVTFNCDHGYPKFCSKKCAAKYNQSLDKVKIKAKQTCIDKYGVSSYTKTQECKDKIKQTCNVKYGVDNYMCSDEFRIKSKNTLLNKYHVDNPVKIQEVRDKMKDTCMNKYGFDSYSKTQEYKNKCKNTCLERYNTTSYTKTQECQEKIYNTKKQNNTHNTSKPEDKVYNLLLTKFNKDDIIRHYKSRLYPFNCDFYIKPLNLYIEYNGYWTHGPESFSRNNTEHIKLLNDWKQRIKEKNFKGKNKKSYKDAIYTWTILDVKKLECFKKNKLNYKIFWTVGEVEDWLKEI